MENLDHLVDLITDRLMEKLKQKPQKPSVYVIGGDKIPDLLEGEGFQVVKDSCTAEIVVVESLGFDAFLRLSFLFPFAGGLSLCLCVRPRGFKLGPRLRQSAPHTRARVR